MKKILCRPSQDFGFLFSSLSEEEDQGRILPSRIVLICLGKGAADARLSYVCLSVTHDMVQLTVCEHSLTD